MFTLRSASRVTVPAAVPESATPARRLVGASAMSTPARQAGVSTPVAATCASSAPAGNVAEARRVEAAGLGVEHERVLAGEPDATATRELAARRGEAEALDVNRCTGDVRGETERDAAGDGAIRDVAADLLTVAVEVGSDRSGEPCRHQRRSRSS